MILPGCILNCFVVISMIYLKVYTLSVHFVNKVSKGIDSYPPKASRR